KDSYQSLARYLHKRIIDLAVELRPKEVPNWLKKFSLNKNEIKPKNSSALTFFIGVKPIPEKIPEQVNFSLRGAYESSNDPGTKALIAGIGLPILTMFASRSLQLEPLTYTSYNNIYVRNNLLEGFTGEFGVSFELPSY